MRVLVIDNYDSFTYNLVQYLRELLNEPVVVRRNDALALEEVDEYDAVVLSPGPGLPRDAGLMPALIREYAGRKPILGVCLGHQAIGEAFGGRLVNLSRVYHGIETPVQRVVDDEPLFAGLPRQFVTGRYHSWVLDPGALPPDLEVIAVDDQGMIMGIRHRRYAVRGVQFHPESIMTLSGKTMLNNFLNHCRRAMRADASAGLRKTAS